MADAPDDDRPRRTFLQRCLTEAGTGKLYLSKPDRDRLRRDFAKAGYDVAKAFAGEEALLDAYLRTRDPVSFMWIYERCRLRSADLPDPLDAFPAWVRLTRREYLRLRIFAKLCVLEVAIEDFDRWVRDECGTRFMTVGGTIGFANERRVLELDRLLAARIHSTRADGPEPD